MSATAGEQFSAPKLRLPAIHILLAVVAIFPPLSARSDPTQQGAAILMRDVLVIGSMGRAGRSAVHTDALEARIVSGEWQAPLPDQVLRSANGREEKWERATADKDGALEQTATRGGYVYWPVSAEREAIMLLEAAGHNCLYVNGEIRAGDPYSYGNVHLPVRLHAGTNDFLFQCSRGRLRAKLIAPATPLLLETTDATLPDLVVGETEPVWGAVMLINASTNPLPVSLRVVEPKTRNLFINLPPLSVRKAPYLVYPPRLKTPGDFSVELEALARNSPGTSRVQTAVKLRVRSLDQSCKRTFLSSIDDSVQYYAVNPAPVGAPDHQQPALFLSLHGASVEAIGQADAYAPKRWGHLVCPTNRRPYGFDWEDWGRLDALEVLELARARCHPDPTRIYLTGHSMGGHGTWQLGALFPDHFAAIGPSAGWISFMSYADTNRLPATNLLQQIMRRSAATSDTLLLATNYLQEGVYILHGDADDNVPVREARQMNQVLSQFHRDYLFHEQPGAGHWWDASDEPGTDCVDWAPMFDFFAHHVIPPDADLRRVRFVTVNPAVSARSHWVTIAAQQRQLEPSAVDVRCDPGKRRFVGATTNVMRLCLELSPLKPSAALAVELDGQKLENVPWPPPGATRKVVGSARRDSEDAKPYASQARVQRLWLDRENGQWQLGQPPTPRLKHPQRSGPFRQAFANHMIFVYATHGTAEENAWAFNKARYDAETFWYRGNGAVPIVSDREFLHYRVESPESKVQSPKSKVRDVRVQTINDRDSTNNVILYGHADCNSAWPVLLGPSPVQIHRGSVRIGERELKGDDLACLFLQPRPQDDRALVGVVAGSGISGLRLAERLPYFLSGAGFPDCLVVGPEMLTKGISGIRVAGFFGQDWSVAHGEFGWSAEIQAD